MVMAGLVSGGVTWLTAPSRAESVAPSAVEIRQLDVDHAAGLPGLKARPTLPSERAIFSAERMRAGQAVVVPSAEDVRFELIGNEPIAGPDGRALVRGWSVLMFRDRMSDRCYVAFKHESSMAVESQAACPE